MVPESCPVEGCSVQKRTKNALVAHARVAHPEVVVQNKGGELIVTPRRRTYGPRRYKKGAERSRKAVKPEAVDEMLDELLSAFIFPNGMMPVNKRAKVAQWVDLTKELMQ